MPKRIHDGSLRRTWRLYNHEILWSEELAAKLNALGFSDFDGKPLHRHSGNGGLFSIFATGHDELADSGLRTNERNTQ